MKYTRTSSKNHPIHNTDRGKAVLSSGEHCQVWLSMTSPPCTIGCIEGSAPSHRMHTLPTCSSRRPKSRWYFHPICKYACY